MKSISEVRTKLREILLPQEYKLNCIRIQTKLHAHSYKHGYMCMADATSRVTHSSQERSCMAAC